MAEILVIVESPAKAKTIEKYLGVNYKVASSFGHISDLPSKNIGIDIENDFEPKYEVSSDKKTIVSQSVNQAKSDYSQSVSPVSQSKSDYSHFYLFQTFGRLQVVYLWPSYYSIALFNIL